MSSRQLTTIASLALLIVTACSPPRSAVPTVAPTVLAPPPTSAPAPEHTLSPRLEAPPRAAASPVLTSSTRPAIAQTPRRLAAPSGPPIQAGERPSAQSSGLTPTPTLNRARLQASGVDACQGANLTGAVGFQGATQALAGDLSLTSHETAPCVLTGSAEVQLIDARGQTLAVKDIAPPDAGQPTPVVVQPGRSAYVGLFWRNWCGSKPALPLQVRVGWPGSGERVTTTLFSGAPSDRHPLDGTPVCNAPGTDSTLSVYPFRATP